MSDSYVQIVPDSSGKKVDTSEISQDSGSVVERQRINISDPVRPDSHAVITAEGAIRVSDKYASEMLRELRLIRMGIEILANTDLK